ncbi:MAG: hypothetical protein ABSB41_19335 [Anaerolineales bacterium]|jgi:hypothetical protein
MADMREQRQAPRKALPQTRDVPGCIKYILLVFLVALFIAELGSGQIRFSNLGETSWLAWLVSLIELLLIVGLIVLIRVQRDLKCQITDPSGCTEETPDPTEGILYVDVKGTAAGTAFGSYTLGVTKGMINYPGIVEYPGGGSTGTVPVVAGDLGRINTTSLTDGTYTITLTVYPLGWGSPSTCTITFDLLKVIVYINRMGGAPAEVLPAGNPNPFDPTAELAVGTKPVSIGGVITVKGSAYIYECVNREIKKYEIRYAQVTVPGGEPAQPPRGAAIPATWPAANQAAMLEYTNPDQYQPWTRVGPMSTDLVNTWNTFTIGMTTYYKLSPGSWNSAAASSGRFSFLLIAEDTTAINFFDIQNVWLDNRPILGQIVKFQRWNGSAWVDIPPCTDLLLSFGKIRVVGLAWDPLIDNAFPVTAPNDNFDHYDVYFWKQFSPVTDPITSGATTRVPAALSPVPTPADAGELGQWDLSLLDAANMASTVHSDNRLGKGSSCTFTVELYVTDNTLVNDGGTTHYNYYDVPVKVVNDL